MKFYTRKPLLRHCSRVQFKTYVLLQIVQINILFRHETKLKRSSSSQRPRKATFLLLVLFLPLCCRCTWHWIEQHQQKTGLYSKDFTISLSIVEGGSALGHSDPGGCLRHRAWEAPGISQNWSYHFKIRWEETNVSLFACKGHEMHRSMRANVSWCNQDQSCTQIIRRALLNQAHLVQLSVPEISGST